MQEAKKTKITEIKEYYTVKRKEKNKLGEIVEVEKTFYKYKEVPVVTGWARFGHFILDRIFYMLFQWAIAFTLGIILGITGNADWLNESTETFLTIIFYIVVYPSYYILFESTAQSSLGKLVLGRIVVNEYGEKPSFHQIVTRSFSRIVPFEPFSCFSDRGWHDNWSDTYVIRKKDLEELMVLARLQEHLKNDTATQAPN
ncbi:MAG: RDD family protein [Bacteroidia bacterium]|nr:RDD family protein [Bacteroidia bacterium]